MQPVSDLYQSLYSQEHIKEAKLTIDGEDYGYDKLVSIETSGAVFGDDAPVMGLAIARKIDAVLLTESSIIPRMAELKPYIRLRAGTTVSEWIPKGTFYIDTREEQPNGYLHIQGFDAMLKAETAYQDSNLSWPAKDIDVVSEIAERIGSSVDSRTRLLMNQQFRIPLTPQYTMREVLKGIAGIYGGSFLINDSGNLQLICLWDRAPETFYLTNEDGDYILVGGDKILLDSWRWE